MGLTSDTIFHSYGINQVMERQISSAFATGFKSVPDLLTTLKRNRGQN